MEKTVPVCQKTEFLMHETNFFFLNSKSTYQIVITIIIT